LPPHIQQRALEDFGSHLSFLAIDAQKYKLISNRQNSPQLAFDVFRFSPIIQELFNPLRKLRLNSLVISQGVALILFDFCLISEAQPHSSNSNLHPIF